MTSIFKQIENFEMVYSLFYNRFYLKLTTCQENLERIQNKENEIFIEEFCLYNDSECQISDIVFENEL